MKSMHLTSGCFDRQLENRTVTPKGAADILFVSLEGTRFAVHRSIVREWLPRLSRARVHRLILSGEALTMLVNFLYERPVARWSATLELITWAVLNFATDLADKLLERAYEFVPRDGIVSMWHYARARNLECELALRQETGCLAPEFVQSQDANCQQLCRTPLTAFLELIRDDRIFWQDGPTLISVILAWARANVPVARACCKELFTAVRFSTFSERQQGISLFRRGFRHLGVPEAEIRRETTVYSSMQPRIPSSLVLYFSGCLGQRTPSTAYFFDMYTNHWAELPHIDLYKSLTYFKSVVIDENIYVIGGVFDSKFSVEVRRFCFAKRMWIAMSSIPDERAYYACTVFDRRIYIFGGHDLRVRLPSSYYFDIELNTWIATQPMGVGRSDAAAVALHDRIIIAGGFDGERTLNRVEAYSPATNSWQDMRPMIEPRSGHCMVLFRGSIYVIGGFQHGRSMNSVERFDAIRNEWCHSAPMTVDRSNFTAVVLEDGILVMGGHSGESCTSLCEKFDGHKWTPVHCLPKPFAAGCAVVLDRPDIVTALLRRTATPFL